MLTYATAAEFREACQQARGASTRIAFVPTMGALHEGHLALIRTAQQRAAWVAVSIFVNPTQFGAGEDFARYPRPAERDAQLLAQAGVQALFLPSMEVLYPPGDQTRVQVAGLSEFLCGPFRPGHFEGVATVVTKLLGLLGPAFVFFGSKDYQQLQIVRRLVMDLVLPVTVVGVPTVRDPDGLALSSRNEYLAAPDRLRALSLSQGLRAASDLFAAGERSASALLHVAEAPVKAAVDAIDYITLAHPDTLVPQAPDAVVGARVLLAMAVRIGSTRLIDNVVLGEDV